MANRLQFSNSGFRKIMRSANVQRDIEKRAERIAAACNAQSSWGGYEWAPASSGSGAQVWSISDHARADNARSNRMLKNLDAGR